MKNSPLALRTVVSNIKYLYLKVMQINNIFFPKIEEKDVDTRTFKGKVEIIRKGIHK